MSLTTEETAAVLTGLRLLQLSLEAGHLPPILFDILTNGDTIDVIRPEAIDDLCERINIGD